MAVQVLWGDLLKPNWQSVDARDHYVLGVGVRREHGHALYPDSQGAGGHPAGPAGVRAGFLLGYASLSLVSSRFELFAAPAPHHRARLDAHLRLCLKPSHLPWLFCNFM